MSSTMKTQLRRLAAASAVLMVLGSIGPASTASTRPSLVSTRWTALGPPGGSLRDLVVSPADPRVVYAGTSNGGVIVSTDRARTWHVQGPTPATPDVIAADFVDANAL